ncbi:glycerophosphodiester phosphodiesterase [Streptomyces tateyamensis]|uniref:Glycerophosphodiester phosphodiesterase n=1 Tax=Streptomyces tateyamensis TaxID=565073 RepID=A0A2V4NC10_9ACTN|nr:glycerophosphodiester phosphodiesterase [Streptomyces tateyamensis]PYC76660.1 glycerophosphodiester phosphodiesterase [Streptomyces tateyamensis]
MTAVDAVRPIAVAHRGDPYRYRENTLASVAAAFAAGADAVEVDVQLTRDGVPVLLHDRTLKRLWGLDRPVARLTAAQLAAQRFAGGERVPTLAEALKLTAEQGGRRLLIDLDDAQPVAATWAAVGAAGAEDLVAFCGPTAAMFAVRELAPGAQLSLTWKQPAMPAAALLADLAPRYLNPPFGLLDAGFMARAAELGLLVSTWTVDTRRTMRRIRALGAASITSNRIGVLRQELDR